MYRFVSFIVIFSVVGITLYYHQFNSHSFTTNSHAMHEQVTHIPDYLSVPTITGSVNQDPTGSWLLKIETTNFTFTPEEVGSAITNYHEGHAHLYINGEKINRIYSNYYNINDLKPGINMIKVTLNGNNHSPLFYKGEEIAFHQTIKVS